MSDAESAITEIQSDSIADALPPAQSESSAPDAPEQTDLAPLPDTPTIKELAQKYLMEKRRNGENLTVKTIKVRVCKEIEERIRQELGACSYQAVLKEVPNVLKANLDENETVTTGGHTIVKTKIDLVKRPPKKTPEPEIPDTTESKAPIKRGMIPVNMKSEETQLEIQMWQFSLDDIAAFIGSFGLPRPKQQKLKVLATKIVHYNQAMIAAGHPEKIIEVGDRLLKMMLMLGFAMTFIQPIVTKFFPPNEAATSNKDLSEG